METPSTPVLINVRYWINATNNDGEPTKQKTFDSESVQAARVGLPEGQEPSKPQAGDYGYSGMHDHGPLIPPKEDGDVAQLLGCAQAAKQFSDEYLTQVIEEEKKKKSKQDNDNNDAKQHQTKKAKTSQ